MITVYAMMNRNSKDMTMTVHVIMTLTSCIIRYYNNYLNVMMMTLLKVITMMTMTVVMTMKMIKRLMLMMTLTITLMYSDD
jgi:hypothetical protein